MVISKLENSEKFNGLHPDFKAVFDVLKTLNKDTTPQRIDVKDGVWVNVSSIENVESTERSYEYHKKFIDIQYVISGEESFGYSDTSVLGDVVKSYNDEGDIGFSKAEGSVFTMKTGDFCILFPEDSHMPTIEKLNDGNLMRAVAKIRV